MGKNRRAKKFTPENIEKIKEWVAQGVGRDEIANRLAVSTGSLQVTCSRLGLSLRKISLAKGGGSIEHIQQGNESAARPTFALLIQTQNRQAEFDLPLRRDVIEQLAFEASVRGLTIPDLIGRIVTQVMDKNLAGEIIRHGRLAGSFVDDAPKTKVLSRESRPARRPRKRA